MMPLVGNIESLKRVYDPKAARSSLSVPINTPNLEIRIVALQPGQRPPYHRHHPEMDEGYLIVQGRGLMIIDGEAFEVRAEDMLLSKRAGFHTMENIGDEDLIEFNFRGGQMPSGNFPFEGDDSAEVPRGVGRAIKARDAGKDYIVGNLFDGTRRDAPQNEKEVGIPKVFATPHLELFAFTRNTGDGNQVHRHQVEMDEAAFFVRGEGRMLFNIDGEEVEAGAGDLIHIPGGAWHFVERVKEGELIVLNIRGGKLPPTTEWRA
jgi:mannose-6-phosphate isomerase-like protein (cupin superfamily)